MWFYPTGLVGFILNCTNTKINKNDSLSLWVYNPSNIDVLLYLEGHSKETVIFLEEYNLKPGENQIRFSFKNHIKKQEIRLNAISIYLKNIETLTILYFDNIRLNQNYIAKTICE